MNERYLGEISFIILVFVLAVVCLPVLAGMIIAFLVGAVDLAYFTIVIVVSCIIWIIFVLMWRI